MSKLCARCHVTKTLAEFPPRKDRKDGRHSWCKKCDNIRIKAMQRKFRVDAVNYAGGKCCRCGYNKYIGALEFHHLDPTQKDFGLSGSHMSTLNDKAKAEIAKCILLCSNCHREEHAKLKGLI